MNRTLLPIRIVFVAVCALSGWLVSYTVEEWDAYRGSATAVGLCLGLLVVLVDVLLKGFSLRGLSALTFGLAVGALVSFLIGASPLLEHGDEQVIFLVRLALFVVCTYLGAVIALRGKDEFQFVLPYVRFERREVDVPVVVVDSSALIDGRIVRICEAQFLSAALVVPEFVIAELHAIADSAEPARQMRGRKGLASLNALRQIPHLDLRVVESDVRKGTTAEEKLVFVAQSMKAKLLTTDYNLAQRAQVHGVTWLNLNALAKSLHTELGIGELVQVELVKQWDPLESTCRHASLSIL